MMVYENECARCMSDVSEVAAAEVFVLLPGFGNDSIDYVEPLGQDKEVTRAAGPSHISW